MAKLENIDYGKPEDSVCIDCYNASVVSGKISSSCKKHGSEHETKKKNQ